MRFEFKPVRMWIDLRDYNPELVEDDGTDPLIPVWVNVPRELYRRMLSASNGQPIEKEAFIRLLNELWGSDWPVADIQALFEHCAERDPGLWVWLTKKTFRLVFDYQAGQKKE